MSNDEEWAELVMPFVAVTSKGGPYDDAAYVAGYEMGVLEGQLSGAHDPVEGTSGPPGVGTVRWIRKANADQVDLIAMKHGRRVEFGETFDHYISVRLIDNGGEQNE